MESRYADNDKRIGFYEREFYVFSNFSAFAVEYKGELFMTSEHAYQAQIFTNNPEIYNEIKNAGSAHYAKKICEKYRDEKGRKDWQEVKLGIMEEILRAKLAQHPYVMKKLKDSGNKELVEDSWRDDFWGWGENKNGQNMLGKIWMKIRKDVLGD